MSKNKMSDQEALAFAKRIVACDEDPDNAPLPGPGWSEWKLLVALSRLALQKSK